MAKQKALQSLHAKSRLASLDKFSTLQLTKEDKLFCYEVSISEDGWSQYNNTLAKERQRIIEETQEQNSTRFYSEKSTWIQSLVEIREDYNRELTAAKKIAAVTSSPLEVNATRLASTLNTKPSIKMDYRPCKQRSNYKCQLGFITKASDEDSSLRYHWDFGDGSTSQRKNPLYTYVAEGEYPVTLRVTDTHDAESSVVVRIKVAKSLKPFALFRTKKRVYTTGESVSFINRSYTDRSKIKTYYWKFGDGTRSSKRNPKHSYHKRGTYVVSLKVCSKNGHCSVASKKLLIKQGKALINAKQGVKIAEYMTKHGAPAKQIVKSKALMTAYKYGDIWLLCKRGKIECAVKDEGLVTNLLGQPKKCYWHEKHAKEYMVELK